MPPAIPPVRLAIEARDSGTPARAGTLATPHATVRTPAFMPVGTRASVKAVTARQVAETGADVVLANTYHLLLRPGEEVVRALGGLHRFMGWERAVLTDSGGFQVFSLGHVSTVSDEGVVFRSHIDGALVSLTPERSIAVQNALGADIIMAFDECVAFPCTRERALAAMERTLRWARRSAAAHARAEDQALFGIVQGGTFPDLRARSVDETLALDLPGYAVGGLSVGEGPGLMVEVLREVAPRLPADRPRYLMGVGTPQDILDAVACGIDMFDCVLPTRNARNAFVFTADGPLRMRNLSHRDDARPLEPGCDCFTCRTASRAYVRHLFTTGEVLALTLATIHNLRYFQRLMEGIRESIRAGTFAAFRDATRARLEDGRVRTGDRDRDREEELPTEST